MKEFIEWYPSEVLNASVYLLHNHNTEIDEILNIDDVIYPTPGSTSGSTSVKMFSINAITNVDKQGPIDFPLNFEEDEELRQRPKPEGPSEPPKARHSGPGAIDTKSDDGIGEDTDESTGSPEGSAKRRKVTDKNVEDIKDVIEENRAHLLKEARSRKPKPTVIEPRAEEPKTEGDHEAKDTNITLPETKMSGSKIIDKPGPSTAIVKPRIDRSHKPPMEVLTRRVGFVFPIIFHVLICLDISVCWRRLY